MQDESSPIVGVVSDAKSGKVSKPIIPSSTQKNQPKIKRVILSVFGILVLVGGVIAGIYLIQRSQDIRKKAESVWVNDCGQSLDCHKIDQSQNSGSYTSDRAIDHLIIKAATLAYTYPGESSGCYSVILGQKTVTWSKVGPAPECHDISHVEVWFAAGEVPQPAATETPTPTTTTTPENPTATPTEEPSATPTQAAATLTPTGSPAPSPTGILPFIASCNGLYTYDTDWNILTTEDLNTLAAGDVIRFATSATVNQGLVTKAKFTINSADQPETTLKKPGTEIFYYDYTIPEGTTEFSVKAMLYHSTQGWF